MALNDSWKQFFSAVVTSPLNDLVKFTKRPPPPMRWVVRCCPTSCVKASSAVVRCRAQCNPRFSPVISVASNTRWRRWMEQVDYYCRCCNYSNADNCCTWHSLEHCMTCTLHTPASYFWCYYATTCRLLALLSYSAAVCAAAILQ